MNSKEAVAEALSLHPNWVAQDADGSWYGFENKPAISEYHNIWIVKGTCDGVVLSGSKPIHNPDWQNTLSEVKS